MRVPLAWRNLTTDLQRLAISTMGIAFAVVLMLMQLGFRNALVDSQVEIVRYLDADLVIVSSAKYQLNMLKPFPRRRLFQALGVEGIVSATPVYVAFPTAVWKNPHNRSLHHVRVLGIDPDARNFISPQMEALVTRLREQDTLLVDTKCKQHIGRTETGNVTELTKRKVRVVGEYSMGTDFQTDATVFVSDRTFFNLFPDYRAADHQLSRVEIGLLRAMPGMPLTPLIEKIKRALPADVVCMRRTEFINVERDFWLRESPVGMVFNLGTVVGFIVGVVICSQILFSDIAEKMAQFATLKAIGYENSYLRIVVLQQATLLAVFGFLPGVGASWLLYQVVGHLTGLMMRMGLEIVLTVFALTLGMCFISGMLAVNKVMNADPADVF